MAKNPFKKPETKKERDIKIEFINKITTVVAAGFGLVIALAWNDAIQSLFKLFPLESTELWAKFVYAFIVTITIVIFVFYFNRVSEFAVKGIKQRQQIATERARIRKEEAEKKEKAKKRRKNK